MGLTGHATVVRPVWSFVRSTIRLRRRSSQSFRRLFEAARWSSQRTLSTTLGYAGSGTSSYVLNGNVEMFRATDLLTNDSGDKIRATVVFMADLRNETVRMDKFALPAWAREALETSAQPADECKPRLQKSPCPQA